MDEKNYIFISLRSLLSQKNMCLCYFFESVEEWRL